MRKTLKTGFLTVGIGLVSLPAAAVETGIEGLAVDGRLKQGVSVAYDLDGQGNKAGPANYVAEVKSSYSPNSDVTFIGNFWLRGDLSTTRDPIEIRGGGLIDPRAGPPFTARSPMTLNQGNCDTANGVFCADSRGLKTLDNANEVIRELSVKYRDPDNRYSVKFGKFQRGWGQSDGLRLLDVLHAQDLRERFVFKDSDELRIPALMLGTDWNLGAMGMAGPFEAIGMNRPKFEFNIVPEVFHSKFTINNPTPSDRKSGGIFGLPFPNLRDPVSNFGLVSIGANLSEKSPAKMSLKDAEYSMRMKFETLGGEGTINMFYGQQDLPVVKFKGGNLLVGNGFNDERAAIAAGGAVVPLPLNDAIGAVHGAYLPWLRSVAAGAPIPFPLTPPCADPVYGTPGAPCSINANFDLDYDYRQKIVGFSFARDLSEAMSFGPKNTSPTVRLEGAYEFKKPFNRSVAPNPIPANGGGPTVTGSNALVIHPDDAIARSDVISTMIGIDYPLWIPGWDTQQKSIFTSFQFFNIHTKKANEGLLAQAPYAFTEVKKNQQFVTFLWNAPIMGERLVLEGMLIKELDKPGYFYRQRADFNFWGPQWRPRIEWMRFSGGAESAPYGMFKNSDFVEFSVTYQF